MQKFIVRVGKFGPGPLIPIACSIALLAGCSTSGLERRFTDNKEVRALQKQSVAQLPEHPINGEGLSQVFKDVAFICAGDNTGRGIPISSDGYHLTGMALS